MTNHPPSFSARPRALAHLLSPVPRPFSPRYHLTAMEKEAVTPRFFFCPWLSDKSWARKAWIWGFELMLSATIDCTCMRVYQSSLYMSPHLGSYNIVVKTWLFTIVCETFVVHVIVMYLWHIAYNYSYGYA